MQAALEKTLPSRLLLESVSQADKVELHEVVRSSVGNDIGRFGEYPDMWSNPVFKSAADPTKYPIRTDIVA
jgi:hypothetical protein